MTNKKEQPKERWTIEELTDILFKNHPIWPATFHDCHRCEKHGVRSGTPFCAHCAISILGEITTPEVAKELEVAIGYLREAQRNVFAARKQLTNKNYGT